MLTDSATDAIWVGIDLAWSPGNPSGMVIARAGEVLAWYDRVEGDEQIVELLWPWLGDCPVQNGEPAAARPGAIIAIDAPLRVPNPTGARPCERELSRVWGWAQAGARPAYRGNVAWNGIVRGEALAERLYHAFGCVESTAIVAAPGARFMCEVYPHPAIVSLFGLTRTIKYKRGNRETRLPELARYRHHLLALQHRDPGLNLPHRLAEQPIHLLRGRALKAYEDVLDAFLCAYIGGYFWRHGPAATQVFGDLAQGHILVPIVEQAD